MGYRRIAAFGPYVGNLICVCFEKAIHDSPHSPESVVQRQLDAYNVRDLDALMAIHANDAQRFEFPATLLARLGGFDTAEKNLSTQLAEET